MDMNRRQFFFLGAGAFAARALGGYNVYTTGIPNETVLKVKPLEINLGIGKAFKAFHFSDTHLNFFDAVDFAAVDEKKQKHFHYRWCRFPQALESFYASLDYAREHRLTLLHTGDLIDFVTEGNERVLRHNVQGLDLFYAIGNHEYQSRAPEHYDSDAAGMRARLRPIFGNDLTVASRVIGGANFVAFDNARHQLRAETIARVKAEFEKGMPVVLMCHIPPTYTPKFIENGFAMKKQILRGQGVPESELASIRPGGPIEPHYDARTMGFWDWARGESSLKAVLCGHTHVEERDKFSDTADMYVAGGNYEGFAYEITFS